MRLCRNLESFKSLDLSLQRYSAWQRHKGTCPPPHSGQHTFASGKERLCMCSSLQLKLIKLSTMQLL